MNEFEGVYRPGYPAVTGIPGCEAYIGGGEE